MAALLPPKSGKASPPIRDSVSVKEVGRPEKTKAAGAAEDDMSETGSKKKSNEPFSSSAFTKLNVPLEQRAKQQYLLVLTEYKREVGEERCPRAIWGWEY